MLYVLVNIHHGCSYSERVVHMGPDEALMQDFAKQDYMEYYDLKELETPPADFCYYIVPFKGAFNINEIPNKYAYRW